MSGIVLYHGTSQDRLKSIRENGLCPRSELNGIGRNTNWTGKLLSRREFIYLSKAFPAFYALQSMRSMETNPVILRIEMYPEELFPDEDFLHWIGFNRERVNLWKHQDRWQLSLNSLGTVATPNIIDPERIVSEVLPMDYSLLFYLGGDLSISPIAFKLLGPEYERRLEVLFRGGLDAVRREMEDRQSDIESLGLMLKHQRKTINAKDKRRSAPKGSKASD